MIWSGLVMMLGFSVLLGIAFVGAFVVVNKMGKGVRGAMICGSGLGLLSTAVFWTWVILTR